MLKVNPASSTISGKRCNNAPPNSDPADKLTKKSNTLSNCFFLIKINKTPTKENSETIITLRSVYNIADIYIKKTNLFK